MTTTSFSFLNEKPSLQTRLRVLLSQSDRYLEERGYPTSAHPARQEVRFKSTRQRVSPGHAKPGEPAASPVWHAQAIGEVCDELLVMLEGDKLDEHAVELAIELGRKLSEWEWQATYGNAIKTGRPVRAGSRLGAKLGGRKKAAMTRETIAKMKVLKKTLGSVSAAASNLAKGNRKKANALRQLWYYHNPSKKL